MATSIHRTLNRIQRIATYCVDGLVGLIPTSPHTGSRTRLLVIKLDALGDFVLWLPVAHSLREAFPKTTHDICLLGNQLWTELALSTSLFDEVWAVERDRLRSDLPYRYRTLLRIRNARFDSVIQAQLSREFFLGDSIVRTCGAASRVGPRGDDAISTRTQLRISDRWYTRLFETLPSSHPELERNADFFRSVTGSSLEDSFPRLEAASFPSRYVEELREPFFVLVPGASIKGKMWPSDNYTEIARRVISRFGWRAVICGDRAGAEVAVYICRALGAEVTDLSGKTTVSELFSVVSRARLYVGNDTGPAHIAAAFNVPTVVVLGGGHFGRFLPYPKGSYPSPKVHVAYNAMDCFRCDWKCPYVDLMTDTAPCLTGVDVENVWQAVSSILGKDDFSKRASVRSGGA
jgi:ADP-heptose:LPS heptosyltransferase